MSPITGISPEALKRIDSLFLRFAAIYGHVWKSLYKSDEFLIFSKKEWFHAVKEFDDLVLDKALATCRKTRKYPPTLPEFIESCNLFKTKNVIPEISPIKMASPETVIAHLNRMRAFLNMKPRQQESLNAGTNKKSR